MKDSGGKYETVIGLEVHLQLATETKVFCGCRTVFGVEPNTQVCPVCLGLPGVLPVLNEKVFEYAIKVALVLGCDIQKTVKFDRKNYYYPDLPKNYQISQYDMPLAYNGKVKIPDGPEKMKSIGITRIHIEEDAGKLLHDPERPYSYVDLNRTGTPLLEIVSEPDIRSPEDASRYLVTLKRIVKYLEVSDCNMEEGSLRCDANISLRKQGVSALGSKVEIKNMNSFKAVRDALAFEQRRQADVLGRGEAVAHETRLWDEKKNITVSMRSKEEAQDYRYFSEPDLVPFEVQGALVEKVRKDIPELPEAKECRFQSQYGLGDKDAENMTISRETGDFFEKVAEESGDAQAACNWIKGPLMMHANEHGTDIAGMERDNSGLSVGIAKIIKMAQKGILSGLAAKETLKIYLDTGKDPAMIVDEKKLGQISDETSILEVVRKVIAANEKSVADYRNGKTNALSFLVGQVMKETSGKANPKIAGEMLRKEIEK